MRRAVDRVSAITAVFAFLGAVLWGGTGRAQTDAGPSDPADAAPAKRGVSMDADAGRDGPGRDVPTTDTSGRVVVPGIDGDRRCAQAARYVHSFSSDGGREALRELTRKLCADGGMPDVSTDEAIDTVVDDAVEVGEGDSGWMGLLVGMFEFGLPLAIGLLAWWGYRRRQERFDEIMAEGEPAFDLELDIEKLRRDPQPLEQIRDEVDEVCVVRLPSSQSGRYGGSSLTVSYAAFLVDAEGKTHEFSRAESWAEVEADAEWVAERLGVEVRDASYGGG